MILFTIKHTLHSFVSNVLFSFHTLRDEIGISYESNLRDTLILEIYLCSLQKRDSEWEHFTEYEPLSKLRLKHGRDGAVFPHSLFGVFDFQRPDFHEVICHLGSGQRGVQSLGFVGCGSVLSLAVGPGTR